MSSIKARLCEPTQKTSIIYASRKQVPRCSHLGRGPGLDTGNFPAQGLQDGLKPSVALRFWGPAKRKAREGVDTLAPKPWPDLLEGHSRGFSEHKSPSWAILAGCAGVPRLFLTLSSYPRRGGGACLAFLQQAHCPSSPPPPPTRERRAAGGSSDVTCAALAI